MNSDKENIQPLRTLKKECPCCTHGELWLYTCDKCNKVFAICDLVFTVFVNALDITMDKVSDTDRLWECPNCAALDSVRIANDDDLTTFGLTGADYE